jgi:hypothetical protein
VGDHAAGRTQPHLGADLTERRCDARAVVQAPERRQHLALSSGQIDRSLFDSHHASFVRVGGAWPEPGDWRGWAVPDLWTLAAVGGPVPRPVEAHVCDGEPVSTG